MIRALFAAAVLVSCTRPTYEGAMPAWINDTTSIEPGATSPLAKKYKPVADKIIAHARADRGAYAKLAELTDKIGARLAGSAALDRAIAWAAKSMQEDGIDVRTQKVMVPHWSRGVEMASVVKPIARDLHLLALGGSVATPRGGITAPVVVVHSWDELDAKREQVNGAIVVYNVAMPAWSDEHGSGYGQVVQYRGAGASRAAKYGAVAALVRSVTARSLSTPHTGAMRYEPDAPKIPTASLSIEDAELLDRLATQGPVSIYLRLDTQTFPDAESANVIGELRGSELPDELVVIGAHIDSWDVGQGAQDDGAGVVTMMQTLKTLKALGLTPRRTIRVVLFTNEENGLRGGRAYAAEHAAETPKTVLALEADSGAFKPVGFNVAHKDPEARKRARARIADIASLLHSMGATRVKESAGGGADIAPLQAAGVPALGLDVDGRHYFDYHHTEADTLDKVKPEDLADMVAVTAVLAFVVADMSGRVDD